MKLINDIVKYIRVPVLDDFERKRKQLMIIEVLLTFTSVIMSIINIITHKDMLLVATATMAILSPINAVVIHKSKTSLTYGMIIFSAKTLLLFTYFIIYGGTEGFSTIWLLLIPACSTFAFGKKTGTVMSMLLLLEVVLLFYTPLRDIAVQCDYTDSFILRFPVLYSCFFMLGYYLEHVRELTYNEIIRIKQEYEYISEHDQLTGLYNRSGFNRELSKCFDECRNGKDFGLFIADIDHFKQYNDNYGHRVGDGVIRAVANRIQESVGDDVAVCRWGGEEFAILIEGERSHNLMDVAESIRKNVARTISVDELEFCVTISIGGVSTVEVENVTERYVLGKADERLYKAKDAGRNLCICSEQ